MNFVKTKFHLSIRKACLLLTYSKSTLYYKSTKDDSEVIEKLRSLAEQFPARGLDNFYQRIRNEGLPWNYKKVRRVYLKLNLNKRIKPKKRIPSRAAIALEEPPVLNHTWSMDFMSDSLKSGQKIRILNIIDDCNREILNIKIAHSINGKGVIEALDEIISERGSPRYIRTDNGPEFTGKVLKEFCERKNIQIKFTQPGKPTQNAYIERFNRTYREDILNAYEFKSVKMVDEITKEWALNFNETHPHKALKGLSPNKFKSFIEGKFKSMNSTALILLNNPPF